MKKEGMSKPFPQIGMSPSVWGPILWTTMHIVTLGYSDKPNDSEKKAAIDFFESLVYMIPCPICQEHYKMNLEKFPVQAAVNSRDDLANWVFMLHNEVNKQLDKPEFKMEQYIKNLKTLSNMSAFKIPPKDTVANVLPLVENVSLPLVTSIALLAGVGIGAAGLYYYQKNK